MILTRLGARPAVECWLVMRQRNFLTIALTLLMLAHGSCASPHRTPAAPQPSRALFLVKQNGKFGYIDRSGRVVIQPQYEHAGYFVDGRALVYIQSKPYFIDGSGKVLFASPFRDYDGTFREGYTGGYVGREGFRYVDRNGAFVEGTFAVGGPFSEGLAAVGVKRDRAGRQEDTQAESGDILFGAIDSTGTFRIPPRFLAVGTFSHGLALVYVGETNRQGSGKRAGKWGYIDRTGRMVIAAQFDWANDLSEGLASVGVGELKGYIDNQGRYAIPLKPHFFAGPFKEGLAYVRDVKPDSPLIGDYYYINTRGDVVLPPDRRFSACDFSEGFVESYYIDGKQGLIDKQGRWLVPPVYDHAGPFQDGLAYVDIDGKIGYVDTHGHFVWQLTE